MPEAKKRILLVDDDKMLIEKLKLMVRDAGYEPILASTGNEAISILHKIDVDLVVSDVNMPQGNGLELLDYVKKNFKLPFIMMTQLSTLLEAQEAMIKGAEYFLAKPFRKQELIHSIVLALEGHKNSRKDHGELIRIGIQEFICGHKLKSDLYLRLENSTFVKIGHSGDSLNSIQISNYRSKGVNYLYVLKSALKEFLEIPREFNSPSSELSKRRKQVLFRKLSLFMNEILPYHRFNPEAFLQAQLSLESTLAILVDNEQMLTLFENNLEENDEIVRRAIFVGFISPLISQYTTGSNTKTFFEITAGSLLAKLGIESLILSDIPGMPKAIIELLTSCRDCQHRFENSPVNINLDRNFRALTITFVMELVDRWQSRSYLAGDASGILKEFAISKLGSVDLALIEALMLAFKEPVPAEVVDYQLSGITSA